MVKTISAVSRVVCPQRQMTPDCSCLTNRICWTVEAAWKASLPAGVLVLWPLPPVCYCLRFCHDLHPNCSTCKLSFPWVSTVVNTTKELLASTTLFSFPRCPIKPQGKGAPVDHSGLPDALWAVSQRSIRTGNRKLEFDSDMPSCLLVAQWADQALQWHEVGSPLWEWGAYHGPLISECLGTSC